MNGDQPARFSSRSVGAMIAMISACFSRINFKPFVEAPRRIHLGRSHQLELDLDRRQESAELPDHVIGETRAASERVGNFRDRDAEVLLDVLAIGHVLRHFAQSVEIVDEDNQPRRPRRLDQMERLAHERRPQNFRHRAQMRQPRRPEAALENYRTRGLVRCDPLCKPPRFFTRPQLRDRLCCRVAMRQPSVEFFLRSTLCPDSCRAVRSRPPRESTDRSASRDFFPRRAAV